MAFMATLARQNLLYCDRTESGIMKVRHQLNVLLSPYSRQGLILQFLFTSQVCFVFIQVVQTSSPMFVRSVQHQDEIRPNPLTKSVRVQRINPISSNREVISVQRYVLDVQSLVDDLDQSSNTVDAIPLALTLMKNQILLYLVKPIQLKLLLLVTR